MYDALVEDGCEEPVPELIDTIDSCLVGEWDLNMDALLGEIKLTDITVRDAPGSSIDGSVTLTFRPDKTLTLEVDSYKEVHDYGDGRAIRITSDGTGDEEWGADGTRLNAIGISGTLDYTTLIEGTIVGNATVEGPPQHLALLPYYQTYFCTAGALTIFASDGFTTNDPVCCWPWSRYFCRMRPN